MARMARSWNGTHMDLEAFAFCPLNGAILFSISVAGYFSAMRQTGDNSVCSHDTGARLWAT